MWNTVENFIINFLFEKEISFLSKTLLLLCEKNTELWKQENKDVFPYGFIFKGESFVFYDKFPVKTGVKLHYLHKNLYEEADLLLLSRSQYFLDRKFITQYLNKYHKTCLNSLTKNSSYSCYPFCCADIIQKYNPKLHFEELGKFDYFFENNDEFKKFKQLVNFYKTKRLVC